MTNKVRGSIIDLPQAAASPPVSGTYTAGSIVYNTGSNSPVGWKYNGTSWDAFGEIILNASQDWDPPSIAAGGITSTSLTVTGAALGDFVSLSLATNLSGLVLSGYVSAANTVFVHLANPTGSTVNVGSSTLRIRIHKQ